jgi:hypothetical protein
MSTANIGKIIGQVVQLLPGAAKVRVRPSAIQPASIKKSKSKKSLEQRQPSYFHAMDFTESTTYGDIVSIAPLPESQVSDSAMSTSDPMKPKLSHYIETIVQPARKYLDPKSGLLYSYP